MTYRAAVCDDSAADAEYIRQLLEQWGQMRSHHLEIQVFSSAESFLFQYEEDKNFDLLLLDIEMGGMDGVTMARKVRQASETIQIVFITGYSDYIAEGYDVAALHYLMKPLDREKFFSVLDRAAEKLLHHQRCLNLELSGQMLRIPLYEIRYLDVRQNYVTVHTREDYTVKRPLGEFEAQLGDSFQRVGRSMIVNLRHIRRVTKTQVCLTDGTDLPLPRGTYEALNRAIIART